MQNGTSKYNLTQGKSDHGSSTLQVALLLIMAVALIGCKSFLQNSYSNRGEETAPEVDTRSQQKSEYSDDLMVSVDDLEHLRTKVQASNDRNGDYRPSELVAVRLFLRGGGSGNFADEQFGAVALVQKGHAATSHSSQNQQANSANRAEPRPVDSRLDVRTNEEGDRYLHLPNPQRPGETLAYRVADSWQGDVPELPNVAEVIVHRDDFKDIPQNGSRKYNLNGEVFKVSHIGNLILYDQNFPRLIIRRATMDAQSAYELALKFKGQISTSQSDKTQLYRVLHLLEDAVDGEIPGAMRNLAFIYLNVPDLNQYIPATELLEKAARLGDVLAKAAVIQRGLIIGVPPARVDTINGYVADVRSALQNPQNSGAQDLARKVIKLLEGVVKIKNPSSYKTDDIAYSLRLLREALQKKAKVPPIPSPLAPPAIPE